MTEKQFNCWCSHDCDEIDATEIPASYAEAAAVEHVKRKYADYDYPETITVHVRDQQGILTKWQVRVIPTVEFYAEKIGED